MIGDKARLLGGTTCPPYSHVGLNRVHEWIFVLAACTRAMRSGLFWTLGITAMIVQILALEPMGGVSSDYAVNTLTHRLH